MLEILTFVEGMYLLVLKPNRAYVRFLVSHNNFSNRMLLAGDVSFKFLPYQL